MDRCRGRRAEEGPRRLGVNSGREGAAFGTQTETLMKSMTTYLNFDGKTREAMTFYQQCLGGELNIQTFKDAHMDNGDPKLADRVVHATLRVAKAVLMASDTQ